MPSKLISEHFGSGMTAHTRRSTRYDFTQPLTTEEATALRHWFENFKPRDVIARARGLAERTIAAIAARDSDPDDFKPYAGMGWYSREIIQRCDWLDKGKARGDGADELIELAYEIGVLFREATLKAAFDDDVEAALRTEDQRKRGGGHNRKLPDAAYIARYQHHRKHGLGISDATDMAAQDLMVSPGTIRNARKRASASD